MRVKSLFALFLAMAFIFGLASQEALAQFQMPALSPKATVSQTIGLTDVTITYSRPGVKGRAIWGSLVPYDQVWRTGANQATTFAVNDDVLIEGQKLAKGTYSLHTIPTPGNWTIIFNKVADQWGSYNYKQDEDALRVSVTPGTGEFVERMRFTIEDMTDSTAQVVLAWEKLQVPFKIQTNTLAKSLGSAKATFGWRPLFAAAQTAAQAKNMEQAFKYLNASLAIEENFQNTGTKAKWLAEGGSKKDAIAAAEKALVIAKSMPKPPADLADFVKFLQDLKKKK